jgi:hypothetical protein
MASSYWEVFIITTKVASELMDILIAVCYKAGCYTYQSAFGLFLCEGTDLN